MLTPRNFADGYIRETLQVAAGLDDAEIERMAACLHSCRERGGRLFFLGVGGSAANASHAVNDFRKLAMMEAYTPTDNVAEITALTNDCGWEEVFRTWLKESCLTENDTVFVLSVGGGCVDPAVSVNLVKALQYAKRVGSIILGIVGRDGGVTKKLATACVVIPTVAKEHVTPHTEGFQSVVLHLLVSHPLLKQGSTTW